MNVSDFSSECCTQCEENSLLVVLKKKKAHPKFVFLKKTKLKLYTKNKRITFLLFSSLEINRLF